MLSQSQNNQDPFLIYDAFVDLIQNYNNLPHQISLILILLKKHELLKFATLFAKYNEKIVNTIIDNLSESVKIIGELHRLDINQNDKTTGIYLFDKIDFTNNEYTILYGNFLKPTLDIRIKLMEFQSLVYSEAI